MSGSVEVVLHLSNGDEFTLRADHVGPETIRLLKSTRVNRMELFVEAPRGDNERIKLQDIAYP